MLVYIPILIRTMGNKPTQSSARGWTYSDKDLLDEYEAWWECEKTETDPKEDDVTEYTTWDPRKSAIDFDIDKQIWLINDTNILLNRTTEWSMYSLLFDLKEYKKSLKIINELMPYCSKIIENNYMDKLRSSLYHMREVIKKHGGCLCNVEGSENLTMTILDDIRDDAIIGHHMNWLDTEISKCEAYVNLQCDPVENDIIESALPPEYEEDAIVNK